MKTLIDHYVGVIDSMSKGFNSPGEFLSSSYYDGPHTIMPVEVSYEESDDIITSTQTLARKTDPQDAGVDTTHRKYSDNGYEKASAAVRLVSNVIHASDSHESAQRELNIWRSYLRQTGGS